jgi:hypothetical protein
VALGSSSSVPISSLLEAKFEPWKRQSPSSHLFLNQGTVVSEYLRSKDSQLSYHSYDTKLAENSSHCPLNPLAFQHPVVVAEIDPNPYDNQEAMVSKTSLADLRREIVSSSE